MLVASILVDTDQEDPRVYAWIAHTFAQLTREVDIIFCAEMLLTINPTAAIPLLEEQLRQHKFNKEIRRCLQEYIAEAPAGNWPFPRIRP